MAHKLVRSSQWLSYCLLSILGLSAIGSSSIADITFKSQTLDTYYSVTVTADLLARSPAWRGGEEKLPITAEQAIRLAGEKKAKLVQDGQNHRWELESVELRRAVRDKWLMRQGERDKWYWLVHYQARSYLEGTGPSIDLRLVVLLDGTVIEPKDVGANSQLGRKVTIEKELIGPLAQVLESISDKFDLTILVDTPEFERQGRGNLMQTQVRSPARKDVALRAVLEDMLKPHGLAIVARRDYIEIVPDPDAKKPKDR